METDCIIKILNFAREYDHSTISDSYTIVLSKYLIEIFMCLRKEKLARNFRNKIVTSYPINTK
jgi:hypothetical protein